MQYTPPQVQSFLAIDIYAKSHSPVDQRSSKLFLLPKVLSAFANAFHALQPLKSTCFQVIERRDALNETTEAQLLKKIETTEHTLAASTAALEQEEFQGIYSGVQAEVLLLLLMCSWLIQEHHELIFFA
ncbi:uncharacterized protein [Spinacia oleracea]|uniref:Uncharacterized protein n=1 Tax=Spinacia oleracea TaxID=3562 RepID=A0ABM3RBS0_SPIOL|nr:uncharacterized protein LOC110778031 [Spinacia oleracea]XP_056693055.1 uncharacterized protein LOC110778031 [Spinacia oleracea]XP_056693056.1 uncharacterized protein LOC110778031 [Spinacia oleracea]XP_056693057.1 uncharacterized protein LOC110778031 [Spinacia oleracea]XP_056693058.1 uncharacterized protein LOC110778031 [Spinacia oleracea]XP_056693059.1 uncharacterized protein LOC110778031 [Spinacia oleracea]XP_056693060.1 uncharacterized protein LOC110778031 [Spinacia oleracea]